MVIRLILIVICCLNSVVNGAVINFNTSLINSRREFNIMNPTIYLEGVVPGPQDSVHIHSGNGDNMITFSLLANSSLSIGNLVFNGSVYQLYVRGNLTVGNANFGTTLSGYNKYTLIWGIMTVTGTFSSSINLQIYTGGIFQQFASSPTDKFLANRLTNIWVQSSSYFYTNASNAIFDNSQVLSSGGSFISTGTTTVINGQFFVSTVAKNKNIAVLGDLVIRDTDWMILYDFTANSVSLIGKTQAGLGFANAPEYVYIDTNSSLVFLFQSDLVIGSPKSTVSPIQGNGEIQMQNTSLTIYNLNTLEARVIFRGDNQFSFTSNSFVPDPSLFIFEADRAGFATITLLGGEIHLSGDWEIFGQVIVNSGFLFLNGKSTFSSVDRTSNTTISGAVVLASSINSLSTIGAGQINVASNSYLYFSQPSKISTPIISNDGTVLISPSCNVYLTGNYVQSTDGNLIVTDLLESKKVPLTISGSATLDGELQIGTSEKVKQNAKITVLRSNSLSGEFSKTSTIPGNKEKFRVKYTPDSVLVLIKSNDGDNEKTDNQNVIAEE